MNDRRKTLAATVLLAAIATQAGCKPGRDFVAAALPSLEPGVNTIVDGLLDGLFAVITPESNSSATN